MKGDESITMTKSFSSKRRESERLERYLIQKIVDKQISDLNSLDLFDLSRENLLELRDLAQEFLSKLEHFELNSEELEIFLSDLESELENSSYSSYSIWREEDELF